MCKGVKKIEMLFGFSYILLLIISSVSLTLTFSC